MKFWSPKGHFRGNKVLLAAQLSGFALETPEFPWKDTNSKEFLTKSPFKAVPALEIASETYLTDSNAIMIYICQATQSELYSGSPEILAEIDSWLETIQTQIEPALCNWINPYFGVAPPDKLLQDKSAKEVKRHLEAIDKLLNRHRYLCGDELTIADISLVSALVYPFRMLIDENQRKSIKSVVELFTKVADLQQFKLVWGNAKFCTSQLQLAEAMPKKKQAEKKKQEHKETEELKSEAKPKPKTEPKPKPTPKPNVEPKPKSTPKPKEEDSEEGEDDWIINSSKAKNPLDLLPESQFVLDDFKRYYSNEKDKQSVMKLFWQTFDEDSYSLWWMKYQKLEGECEKIYMTCNAVDGFLQRIEVIRRHCFGVIGVYGDEPNLEIMGLFMWRGKGIPIEILEHSEYYDKLELSSDNPEHRQRVEDYWCNLTEDLKVDGLTPREIWQFK
ncbi:EEF1G_3 [Blepharisma stoltei]|uniref:Elongation factor 1-gamma n=1 Tax=Blepharisma stoltei TaxID=1481888 RepID=A0AAU9K085_9CILI|nr:unnamed protein product [Blepharisma stoltei]